MPRLRPIILCIDDHESGLGVRKLLLEDEGYEVLTATDGRHGLELFRSQSVDAVILDYRMPEMCGDVVASRMKRIKPDIPILLLSGYCALPDDKLQSADIFMCKAQPIAAFLATVQQLLSKTYFFDHWISIWKAPNGDMKSEVA